ncbi:hypothetical protein PFISCL1PPCAC_5897, partial [Pristionchus fissidentatus]
RFVFFTLLTIANAWPYITKYAHVHGALYCITPEDTKHMLEHVDVRMWEHDAVGSNDVKNATETNEKGEFELIGSEREMWGHEFFIDIRIPCWKEATKACSHKGLRCEDHKCEHYVKIDVPQRYNYERGDNHEIFDIPSYNIVNPSATEIS